MSAPRFEFHVSRDARRRYRFDGTLYSLTGNVLFANLAACRQFAQRMNEVRDAASHPERSVNAGGLNAMALIDEALHAMIAVYREQQDPRVLIDALDWFEARLSRETLDRTLLSFIEEFPPVAVFREEVSPAEWLRGTTATTPHRAIALEEMMMLWLANANPAFQPFEELFADLKLAEQTAYSKITASLRDYFETRPRFEDENLFDLLRAPALTSPDSLSGQLAFIRRRWARYLGENFKRFLQALDVLKEEEMAVWLRFHPPTERPGGRLSLGGDSGATAIPHYARTDPEYERFSPDVDWMPRTVLIAKSTYVWLDQLSKKYRRDIHRLDQVPDEELDLLARHGFNALWLIGVWERSQASQRVKQIMGKSDAVASAYSLFDYSIADDLGGESSYVNLKERAGARGVRLASDMVPNHMGIDSNWVVEHPDWFLSLPYTPYPAYKFDGPDLSSDGRVEIKIEDHYYDHTDAAVVFRRVDRWSGDTRYIYHGNDGTSFPWNDTAQLNYLRADVREAVIQTILHVARMFPIIRFDAAMTLAKRHFQRLWFPEPGTGGAIPSRAEYGMTKAEFDKAIPLEFWREVVDRVATEVPGTLLLAEAFWLMEGYFVRTLGMHRVYNSAFMNMMRDEENANYRSVIKNTIEFDPDILKRYVNFMNNPDERTAVEQFGKGDKYFGICTVMATLPGLPMFGHGQVEGFTEKYGMEYRRAYHDEKPDQWLVARHEREISPLLHRRSLFAESENFLLYDFYSDEGWVNEDVYAYSNCRGSERVLVIFHNKYATARGWVRTSCAYAEKLPDGGRRLRQQSLGESFNLSTGERALVAFRDAFTGLEYLHNSRDVAERGLHLELGAYKCQVLLDWQDIVDDGTRPWSELCSMLAGSGVASLDDALRALELKPVHQAIYSLLDPKFIGDIAATAEYTMRVHGAVEETAEDTSSKTIQSEQLIAQATARLEALIETAHRVDERLLLQGSDETPEAWSETTIAALKVFSESLKSVLRLPSLMQELSKPWPLDVLPGSEDRAGQKAIWGSVVAWCALHALGVQADAANPNRASFRLFEELHLHNVFANAFGLLGLMGEERWRASARVRVAFAHASWAPGVVHVSERSVGVMSWIHDAEFGWLIGAHEHEGVRYLVKEPYESLLWWMALPALLQIASEESLDRTKIRALEAAINQRMNGAKDAGYRLEELV